MSCQAIGSVIFSCHVFACKVIHLNDDIFYGSYLPYVNQPKTSKSITLCEYLCHHSNFSATLLKPNPIHYFWRGPNNTEIYGQMGVQIFQEGPIISAFN